MGQEGLITKAHGEEVRKVAPGAAAALQETKPGHLDRLLKDLSFPPRKADGGLVGRGTFQIVFDRKLASSEGDEGATGNDIANWLYCEWSEEKFKDGDRFIIASGTITKDNEVDVTCAGLAVVKSTAPVTFVTAGKVAIEDGEFRKMDDLSERALQSFLSGFRNSFVNGATLYSGDLES